MVFSCKRLFGFRRSGRNFTVHIDLRRCPVAVDGKLFVAAPQRNGDSLDEQEKKLRVCFASNVSARTTRCYIDLPRLLRPSLYFAGYFSNVVLL